MPSYDAGQQPGRSGFPLQDTFHLKMITLRQRTSSIFKAKCPAGISAVTGTLLEPDALATFGIIIFTIPKHFPHLPLVSQTSQTP